MKKNDEKGKLEHLEMQFDPQTIEHLGVQMYSTLPPVIAELISNSYDADAKEVKIELFDEGDKLIRISDNGHGMTFNNLNEKHIRFGAVHLDVWFDNMHIDKEKEVTFFDFDHCIQWTN